jgi:hypothetical protein
MRGKFDGVHFSEIERGAQFRSQPWRKKWFRDTPQPNTLRLARVVAILECCLKTPQKPSIHLSSSTVRVRWTGSLRAFTFPTIRTRVFCSRVRTSPRYPPYAYAEETFSSQGFACIRSLTN